MKEKQYKRKNQFGTFYYKDSTMSINHRTDGPAVELVNGDKVWFVNGKAHRLDGPAYEYASGEKSWYVNGMAIFRLNNIGKFFKEMR